MRICSRCHAEHDGKQKSYCPPCWTAYVRQWYLAHKDNHKASVRARSKAARPIMRSLLNAIKDVPCLDCGGRFPPYAMDFDHLGNKKFLVSTAPSSGVSKKRLAEEIAKCEIVCANCHRIRTHNRSARGSKDEQQIFNLP